VLCTEEVFMTSKDPADPSDPTIDVWSRLRAYRSSVSEQVIPQIDQFGSWGSQDVVCYPPATDEQLHATEEKLGFPLPPDLRRLYAEVANGGLNLGPVHVFHGAIGGCGVNPLYSGYGPTIEKLASMSGWRLHPRIEDALLRHPGRYVIADSLPDGFIYNGEDSEFSLEIDAATGHIYYSEGWGYLPDRQTEVHGGLFDLITIQANAPSLRAWFARWLDEVPYRGMLAYQDDWGELLPEMVETDDLPDPEVVWRGLYRFEPASKPQPEEMDLDDLAYDAEHAIYWTYVDDAE
jgi:hypothetical protein